MYALDTSVISALHRNFYRSRFVTLWQRFDELVVAGEFTSTREVLRELEDLGGPTHAWAMENEALFATPDAAEGAFVAEIFKVPHFHANMERQKLLQGGRNADPFIIARAAVTGSTVLTMEKIKPNAAKIPNICEHFQIPCLDLEKFMEAEQWKF